MRTTTKKTALLLSGAASALAATGVIAALAVVAPASGDPAAQGPPPTGRVWSTTVSGGSADAGRSARPAAPSARAVRAAEAIEADNPDLELNAGQARTVSAPSKTAGAWTVVPGNGGACVVRPDDSLLCGDDATFERSGAAIAWTLPPRTVVNPVPEGQTPGPGDFAPATSGDMTIDGLAVDAVERAEVIDRFGDVIATTDVDGSVFSLAVRVEQQPHAVRIVGTDGGSSLILLDG